MEGTASVEGVVPEGSGSAMAQVESGDVGVAGREASSLPRSYEDFYFVRSGQVAPGSCFPRLPLHVRGSPLARSDGQTTGATPAGSLDAPAGGGGALRVVCLGGGWTTLYLVRRLRRAIRKGRVQVTVVSRDNYHTFHGFIGEVLAGRIQPEQIISPARRIFAPARFHNAEIESVDPERKVVTTSRLMDGRPYELEYDQLVVAVGSVDDLERYPGVAEHALRVKSYWEVFKARSRLLAALEMAEIEPDPEERRRLLTIVVVGGNFGGIEVAAEILDYFRTLARGEYPGIDPEEIRVMIIHSGQRILPELQDSQPKMVRYAEEFLEKSGLEFRLGRRVTAATREEAVLDDGERIPTRTILSCAGTATAPLLKDGPFELDGSGRLPLRPTGQLQERDDVWAGGDCASMPHPDGGVCPQVAVHAMMGGRHVGANILRRLKGKPLRPFRFSGLGEACSLGQRHAVYHLKGFRMYGRTAWLLWRLTFLGFIPSWERRLRILSDWLVVGLFGRDIVNVQMHEPFGVRPEVYEPGQPIVREGEVGRHLYLIKEGEVEVVRRVGSDGGQGEEEHLATLGAGQHFGEAAIFEDVRRTATVRARTRVRVLSLGHSTTLALSRTLRSFEHQVTRLPESRETTASDESSASTTEDRT